MIKRYKPFAGLSAFYTDPETGLAVSNNRGEAATDRDVDHFFRQVEPDLDRLTLEMCAHERAQGNQLEKYLLDAELAAFKRTRLRDAS